MRFDTIGSKDMYSNCGDAVQTIKTDSHYVVFFNINNKQYMAVTVYVPGTLKLYRWDIDQFIDIRKDAPVEKAFHINAFNYGGDAYIVVASQTGSTGKCVIYKLNNTTEDLQLIQSIDFTDAYGLDVVEYNGDIILGLASNPMGHRHYKFNTTTGVFDYIAQTSTLSGYYHYSIRYFIMEGELYYVIGANISAVYIYKLNTTLTSSTLFQITGEGGKSYDSTYYEFNNDSYLLITSNSDSMVLKLLRFNGTSFVPYITFTGFTRTVFVNVEIIDNTVYILVTIRAKYNTYTNSYNYNNHSYILKLSGNTYVEYLKVPSYDGYSVSPLTINNKKYVMVGHTTAGYDTMYKFLDSTVPPEIPFKSKVSHQSISHGSLSNALTFESNSKRYIIWSCSSDFKLDYLSGTTVTNKSTYPLTSAGKATHFRHNFNDYIAIIHSGSAVNVYLFNTSTETLTLSHTLTGLNGAMNISSIRFDGSAWLTVSCYKTTESYSVKSIVYKFGSEDVTFNEFTKFDTLGSIGCAMFIMGGNLFIGYTNGYSGETFSLPSALYVYNRVTLTFDSFQYFYGNFASSIRYFEINNRSYIVMTELGVTNNDECGDFYTKSIQHIYEYNGDGKRFMEIQRISGYSGVIDSNFVSLNNKHYLFLAVNHRSFGMNEYDYNNYSPILLWNESDRQFREVHREHTYGAVSLIYYILNNVLYFVFVNTYSGSTNNQTASSPATVVLKAT